MWSGDVDVWYDLQYCQILYFVVVGFIWFGYVGVVQDEGYIGVVQGDVYQYLVEGVVYECGVQGYDGVEFVECEFGCGGYGVLFGDVDVVYLVGEVFGEWCEFCGVEYCCGYCDYVFLLFVY